MSDPVDIPLPKSNVFRLPLKLNPAMQASMVSGPDGRISPALIEGLELLLESARKGKIQSALVLSLSEHADEYSGYTRLGMEREKFDTPLLLTWMEIARQDLMDELRDSLGHFNDPGDDE